MTNYSRNNWNQGCLIALLMLPLVFLSAIFKLPTVKDNIYGGYRRRGRRRRW